jgi:hypothetical protein
MKGSLLDLFYMVIVIFMLGVSILAAVYVKDQIFPPLSSMLSSSSDATSVLTTVSNGFSIFDEIFLFMFIMLSIIPIIFAFLVPTHPVFILINIILFLIYLVVVPSLSNAMRSFWSSSFFAPYAAGGSGSTTYVIMTAIFQYLPIITCAFGLVLTVVTFVKFGGGNV